MWVQFILWPPPGIYGGLAHKIESSVGIRRICRVKGLALAADLTGAMKWHSLGLLQGLRLEGPCSGYAVAQKAVGVRSDGCNSGIKLGLWFQLRMRVWGLGFRFWVEDWHVELMARCHRFAFYGLGHRAWSFLPQCCLCFLAPCPVMRAKPYGNARAKQLWNPQKVGCY